MRFWSGNRSTKLKQPFALLLGIFLLLPAAAQQQTVPEPTLKPDVPKLDLTPTPHKTLKGGVSQQGAAPQTKKLSSSASNIFKKKKSEKLTAQTAKGGDSAMLKQNASQSALNAQIQEGVGIIGVKFLLPIGHMPIINRVFPGTPAWSMGLHPHDIIVAVDGVPTLGLSKEDVYGMIVGKPDTDVTISIRRGTDFIAKTMKRMDFNDIPDPAVRMDYLMSI